MVMVAKSRSEYICFMGRGVDMRGVPPRDDGIYRGVPPRDDGIYRGVPSRDDGLTGGGAIRYRWNRLRPAFMEPLGGTPGVPQGVPPGVPPPNGGVALQLNKRNRSSSFPLKDDAGYIGYLTDDDDDGENGSSRSGDEGEGDVRSVVDRRRRELMGSDISFSGCMFMMITVCGLLMLFIFAASPWGVPPPRRLGAP
jgi:hypothetical protein